MHYKRAATVLFHRMLDCLHNRLHVVDGKLQQSDLPQQMVYRDSRYQDCHNFNIIIIK